MGVEVNPVNPAEVIEFEVNGATIRARAVQTGRFIRPGCVHLADLNRRIIWEIPSRYLEKRIVRKVA